MHTTAEYPYLLKDLLKQNQFENIVDSNILTPYIPEHSPIPRIQDPRKTQQSPDSGIPRHPGYVKSAEINQIFNYIGFIKRMNRQDYAQYLPLLFKELKRFIRVVEEIVYEPFITISADIYAELEEGLQHFFNAYHNRSRTSRAWIEEIWKFQKIYLEQIDMFLKTLEVRGHVFDLKSEALHLEIYKFCKDFFHDARKDPPSDTDMHFVANCCTKAALEDQPKTIWSGDRHISRILFAMYAHSDLVLRFPQIYLRASYLPFKFEQLFPAVDKQEVS